MRVSTATLRARDYRTAFDRPVLLFCLLVLGVAILYPTARLLLRALREWRWEAILQGAGLEATVNTLAISLLSVLCAGLLGTALALVVTRWRFPGSRVLSAMAYLPFTLPPLVGVLSFYYLIGRDGFFTRALERVFATTGLEAPGALAILLIHTYSFYVFFYAMTGSALESLDRSQVEAARTLGASRMRAFFKVTLPQLQPALRGAALLTFMSSGASFSAPYFFGGDFPMLSVAIYDAATAYHMPQALTLTVVLAAVSLLGVALFRSRRQTAGSASKGVAAPVRGASARFLASAAAWAAILLLLIPHITILYLSFIEYREWHAELLPTSFTLQNYVGLIQDPNAVAPIRNSLWMSALATAGTLAVGLPAAYLIARRRPGGRWVNLLVMIPWALPGSVIAMNLIVAFNDPWLPLYSTIWLLPLAYFVRNVPLLTRMAGAAIEPFDASLLEAGRSLGGTPRYCLWRIVAPLLAPAVVASMALVFALSLGEFVASILLYTPGNLPISVKINMIWRTSIGPAFAYSVLLMTLVAAAFIAARRFTTRAL